MLNEVIKHAKNLKSLGWKNIHPELECVKFEVRAGKVRYALTQTRVIIAGSFDFDINQNFDLYIHHNDLLKLKKPTKFEFFEGGIRVYTSEGLKTLKSKAGYRYPDFERIMDREKKSTLKCDLSELGTFCEVIEADVKLTLNGNLLDIVQGEIAQFKMSLPCEGTMIDSILLSSTYVTMLAKNEVKEFSLDTMGDGIVLLTKIGNADYVMITWKK